jgi:hypothetical protein
MSLVKYIPDIEEIFSGMSYCLDNLYNGLKQYDPKTAEKVTCFLDSIHDRVPSITEQIISETKKRSSASRYVLVPALIGSLQEDVRDMTSSIINRRWNIFSSG